LTVRENAREREERKKKSNRMKDSELAALCVADSDGERRGGRKYSVHETHSFQAVEVAGVFRLTFLQAVSHGAAHTEDEVEAIIRTEPRRVDRRQKVTLTGANRVGQGA
jgi:hypothetical protein